MNIILKNISNMKFLKLIALYFLKTKPKFRRVLIEIEFKILSFSNKTSTIQHTAVINN